MFPCKYHGVTVNVIGLVVIGHFHPWLESVEAVDLGKVGIG